MAPSLDFFTFGSENLEKAGFVSYALCAKSLASNARIWCFSFGGQSCLPDRPDHAHDTLFGEFWSNLEGTWATDLRKSAYLFWLLFLTGFREGSRWIGTLSAPCETE